MAETDFRRSVRMVTKIELLGWEDNTTMNESLAQKINPKKNEDNETLVIVQWLDHETYEGKVSSLNLQGEADGNLNKKEGN